MRMLFISTVDIDECSEKTSKCQQLCNNTLGSFECMCLSGYSLNADKTTCFLKGVEFLFILQLIVQRRLIEWSCFFASRSRIFHLSLPVTVSTSRPVLVASVDEYDWFKIMSYLLWHKISVYIVSYERPIEKLYDSKYLY